MENMTPIIQDLTAQIAFYAVLVSIIVAGIKKAIKITLGLEETVKLNRFVALSLTSIFGILFGFLLESPLLSSNVLKVLFGVSISLFALISYDAVIKSLLKVIPAIIKRVTGTK